MHDVNYSDIFITTSYIFSFYSVFPGFLRVYFVYKTKKNHKNIMNLWKELWRVLCQVEVSHDIEAILKVGWRKTLTWMLWLIRFILKGRKSCFKSIWVLEITVGFMILLFNTTWSFYLDVTRAPMESVLDFDFCIVVSIDRMLSIVPYIDFVVVWSKKGENKDRESIVNIVLRRVNIMLRGSFHCWMVYYILLLCFYGFLDISRHLVVVLKACCWLGIFSHLFFKRMLVSFGWSSCLTNIYSILWLC